MAASSQPLATLAGNSILARGGNAVDAAVAMVSVLNVVEPYSVGIGGDAFALIYLARDKRIVGMNGSGRAPYGANIDVLRGKGFSDMPERGMLPVTVPGALHGWVQAVERYGRLSPAEVFSDAIRYAEEGFPVTEVIAGEWAALREKLAAHPSSAAQYLLNGAAPRPGRRFRNPNLARSYRLIAEQGAGALYGGELCSRIVRFSEQNGGLLTEKDFLDHETSWVEPVSTDYRGYTVYELPPNGQGITALQMLNVLKGFDLQSMGHNSPEYLHLLVEAKKIAFADRDFFITDPDFERTPVEALLSDDYARKCRSAIDPSKAMDPPAPMLGRKGSDTVYVTAVDAERNAVSFISSIYMGFGSGMVVDGTGITLHNRGYSFSLDPNHPNRLEPHKRPKHTIIPGMLCKDGEFVMTFGVMGADMQPQGHVQFLANCIDFGMNLQEAMDAPRVRHFDGKTIYLEDGIPASAAGTLKAKGHILMKADGSTNQVGGGQAIYLDREEDVLLGASDRRKDGCAIGS